MIICHDFLNSIIEHLKTAIRQKWGAPECKQEIRGWSNDPPANNDVKLKTLNLPPSVQLSVYVADSPKESKKTVNGISGKSYVSVSWYSFVYADSFIILLGL